MKTTTPTYQEYLNDPRVRERLEREMRVARAEAFRQYVLMPLAKLFTVQRKQRSVLRIRPA